MSGNRGLKEGVPSHVIAHYDEYSSETLKEHLLDEADSREIRRNARQIISALKMDNLLEDPALQKVVAVATQAIDRQQPTPRILPIKGAHQKRT